MLVVFSSLTAVGAGLVRSLTAAGGWLSRSVTAGGGGCV